MNQFEKSVAAQPARAPSPRDAAALPPAAQRALAEAQERRQERRRAADAAAAPPKEINGRQGPEPARYGDWEVNGIASDF